MKTNLKAKRLALHILQKDVADKAGVKRKVYQHYELGTHPLRDAKFTTVQNIAKALHCARGKILSR